ncbi:hypothetical protein CLV62_13719 [Dysgonomonas alginatilytica]|uniref:Uncharacterized protein n=1 Tax=Dysgonomonas alginatilytica TaxID=1605892 RepID=A0A2V3PL56_9BACT|nr:hypothetical protein CLV62_13719 [Dysgonomonas alginatilytica]
MEKINTAILYGGKKASEKQDFLDGFLTVQDGRDKVM